MLIRLYLEVLRGAKIIEITVSLALLLCGAVFLAGVSKGGFGSGVAFISTPILALALEPAQALGIMLPLLMLADLVSLKLYWKRWDLNNSKVLIIGGAGGVIIAIWFYQFVSSDILRMLIGGVSLSFVSFQMFRHLGIVKFRRQGLKKGVGLMVGLLAGFTSFVSHAGGPPVAMFLLSQGVNKTVYQATTVISFFVINIFKVVPYAFLGLFTLDTLKINLLMAPVMVLGTLAGALAHRIIPERLYFGFSYLLLVITGIKLFWDALT